MQDSKLITDQLERQILFKSQFSRQMSGIIPLRTDHQKYQQYYGNGGGRDTYVITGQGGFLHDGAKGQAVQNSPFTGFQTCPNSTMLYINQGNQLRKSQPSKELTSMSYYGDGSGRDTYVIHDFGGLIQKYRNKGSLQDFKHSLRQPRREISNHLDDAIRRQRL